MAAESSNPVEMRVVPARQGGVWLAGGLRLFRASPARWTFLVLVYWFLIAMINQIPYIGSALVALCLPGFSASFMIGCRELRHARPLMLAHLASGFMQHPGVMPRLGIVYLISMVFVLGIAALADGGILMNWILFNQPPDPDVIKEGKLSSALLLASLAATPILMGFWFAPMLAAFNAMGAGKSLFFSFFACMRNWRALFVYGGAVLLFAMFISVFVALFSVLAGGDPQSARGFMLAATLMIMPPLFGSFYVSYEDVFPERPPEIPAPVITPPEA
jgi:hypothetical protein